MRKAFLHPKTPVYLSLEGAKQTLITAGPLHRGLGRQHFPGRSRRSDSGSSLQPPGHHPARPAVRPADRPALYSSTTVIVARGCGRFIPLHAANWPGDGHEPILGAARPAPRAGRGPTTPSRTPANYAGSCTARPAPPAGGRRCWARSRVRGTSGRCGWLGRTGS